MTKLHIATEERTSFVARLFGSVVRGICALACFPYEAMQHLQDWRSKIDVLCRGLAVVIGPTVGGIALFTYAGAVFGNAAIILFLPLLAFLIDWRITGSAYDGHREKSLSVMRLGLALLSCLVATYASLLSEQAALEKSMRVAETRDLEQGKSVASAQYLVVNEQLAQASTSITENERRLHRERPVIVARLNTAQMLYEKECRGVSGTDAFTGVRVIGGRCGQRAAGHKAEADAARRNLAELDQLVPQNDLLKRQVVALQRQQQEILSKHLTTSGSVGAMFKAIQYADVGTWISVGSRFAVLVFCELLCLGWARIRPSQNVIDAVADLSARDSRRLELFHAASLEEVNRNVPPVMFTVDDGDPLHRANVPDEAAKKVVPLSLAQAGVRA